MAQQAAPGGGQLGAVFGGQAAAAGGIWRTAGLEVAVLAGVEHMEAQQLAVGQPVVDPHGIGAAQARQAVHQGRCAQGHVFIKSLVGRSAAQQEVGGIFLALATRVVVFDLVVVPGDDPGAQGVGGLQGGVAAVQGVAVAVVGQVAGVAQRVAAGQGGGGHTGAGVFVDVVAQENDGVGLLGAQVAPGGVVAVFPALAGRKGKPKALHLCAGRCQGAGAACGAGGVAQGEAVEVPAVAGQAGQLHMYAVAQLGQGGGLAAAHRAAEMFVVGQFPAQGHGAMGRGQSGGCEAGPEHHAVVTGGAAGHTPGKRLAAHALGGPCTQRQAARRCSPGQAAQEITPLVARKGGPQWRFSWVFCFFYDSCMRS